MQEKKYILFNLVKASIALLFGIFYLHDAFVIKNVYALFSPLRLLAGISLIVLSLFTLYNLFKKIKNSFLMELIYIVVLFLITMPIITTIISNFSWPIVINLTFLVQVLLIVVCLVFYYIVIYSIKDALSNLKK